MSLFNLFSRKKEKHDLPSLLVDIHSHLLPGLDDGSESWDESIDLIKEFIALGYKKIITTPHIMGDFYKNTPTVIFEKLEHLRSLVKEQNLDISIEAAAEYYLDESFVAKLNSDEKLLTFGSNYLLFETSYINEPSQLFETIFLIKAKGYWPVLAHPERYTYLYNNLKKYAEIFEKGISFQINVNSLSGYYSKTAQKIAVKLIEGNMVNFIGSDCHGKRHMEGIKKTRQTKEYRKLAGVYLLNNSLL